MTEDDLKPYLKKGFVKDTISYEVDKNGNFAVALGQNSSVVFSPTEARRMALWILHHFKGTK